MSGTSMATPHVAGVAALWWEELHDSRPRVTAEAVRDAIRKRKEVFGAAYSLDDHGAGLVDAP